MERDGLAVVVGWTSAALSLLILGLLSKAILAGIMAFTTTLLSAFN